MAVYGEEILYGIRVPGGRWRNFGGYEYGRERTQANMNRGQRSFNAFLSEHQARVLEEKGWPIKWTTPREEGDEPQPFMTVKVAFGGKFPVEVQVIQGKNAVEYNNDNINLLDHMDFDNVDIRIRPWNRPDGGVSVYLQSGYFTKRHDELAEKYAQLGGYESDEEIPFV